MLSNASCHHSHSDSAVPRSSDLAGTLLFVAQQDRPSLVVTGNE